MKNIPSVRVATMVFAVVVLVVVACSGETSSTSSVSSVGAGSSPSEPGASSSSTSEVSLSSLRDCPSPVSSLGDEGFGRVDWFSGRVEVPVDLPSESGVPDEEDVAGIRLVGLNPVYSLPVNAWPRFRVYAGEVDLGFELELRDSAGVVLSQPFLISADRSHFVRVRSSSGVFEEVFSVRVVDPPVYDSFAVKVDGRELAAVELSAHAPSVSVSGVCEGRVFEQHEQVRVAWQGQDEDGDRLTYKVFRSYNAGSSWSERTVSDFSGSQWDFLKFGADEEVLVAVSVSDGTRSTFAVTPAFRVAEHGPQVRIKSPVSGATFYGQQKFQLSAGVRDPDQNTFSAPHSRVWHSSLDGHLGDDLFINTSADQFTPGEHTITVVVTDKTGRQATDSISVNIGVGPPRSSPGFADSFAGRVSVHYNSDDTSAIQLKELDPVRTLPKQQSGWTYGLNPHQFGFELELRDNTGAAIRNIPFDTSYSLPVVDKLLLSGPIPPYTEWFRIRVLDPPDYASFAIKANGAEIAVINRSPNAPTVAIQNITENQSFTQDEDINITWTAQDQDQDPLTYKVFQSHDNGITWRARTRTDTEQTQWNDFDFQPTDQAKIAISVSDGTRSTFTTTPTFKIKL